MQLDVTTSLFVSGVITSALSLSTLFYSLAVKENRPFLWAALASACFAVCMFLASYRGVIPDLISIVVTNVLAVFSLFAFYELFCRLLDTRPRERMLAPIVLVLQFGLFIWLTYFQPSFPSRVFVLSLCFLLASVFFIKLLWANATKDRRLFYLFASLPFGLLFLYSTMRIVQFVGGFGMEASSLHSPAYALSIIFYAVLAIWISLSAVFIVSNRMRIQIRETALTDPLTGALNRRALREAADKEFSRAARHDQPLSLIMADLDHFKKVNDTHGHQAGDAVLVHTAALFRKMLRNEDFLARFGGEEFVLLLPGADQAEARAVAERLRAALKAEALSFQDRAIPITASFGVADGAGKSTGYEELVKAADAAMYQAKEQGRDRVVVAG